MYDDAVSKEPQINDRLRLGNVQLDFPIVQAALSGYSDWPMRVIARRLGAPYTICEVMLDKFVVEVTKGSKARIVGWKRNSSRTSIVSARLAASTSLPRQKSGGGSARRFSTVGKGVLRYIFVRVLADDLQHLADCTIYVLGFSELHGLALEL